MKKDNKKNKKKNKNVKSKITTTVSLIVVLAVFYMIFCGIIGNDTFYPNTSINGISVSRMTVAEASEAVKEQFEKEYGSAAIEVTLNDEAYCVSISEALDMDVTDAVQDANDKGHKFFSRGINYVVALFASKEYDAMPSLESTDSLYTAVDESGLTDYENIDESFYTISNDKITFTKGRGGYVVDTDELVSDLVEVIESGDYSVTIECPITYGEINLQTIYDEIYVEPVDASLDPANNYAVTDSVTGVSFDLDAAQVSLDAAADGEEVTIELIYTEPELDSATLEAYLFRDKLGSYSTTVTGTDARKANVNKAAENCSGTILLPGEQFSFNDVVGQRTVENGFQSAPSYVNGESVDEVGGGICQVSSTLYQACLYANLQIDERRCHPYPSTYIGIGLDATVSWGGPDYKFTNNTDYPIKIVASYSGGVVYCSIYGTELEAFSVSITTEIVETYEYETEYEDDDTLEEGKEEVSVTGKNGYKVQSYRTVYDASGNVISSEKEAVSSYSKRNEVILVGTMEVEEEDEEDDSSGNKKKKKKNTEEDTEEDTEESSEATTTEEVTESTTEEATEASIDGTE